MLRRLLLSLSVASLFVASAFGTPLTFNTPYVITDPYSGPTGANPTTGDVMGSFTQFDISAIKFLQLDSTLIRAEIDLNYDEGDSSLGQFSVGGDKLNIGDLLFGNGNGQYSFGVPIKTHSVSPNSGSLYSSNGVNVLAGALYQIQAGGVLLAKDVLGYTATTFNPNEAVWLWNSSQTTTLTKVSNPLANPVSVSGITGKELAITISFVPTLAFLDALSSGTLFVHFASATCANDIINGQLQAVPEPATWSMMLGAALLGAGLWRRRKS